MARPHRNTCISRLAMLCKRRGFFYTYHPQQLIVATRAGALTKVLVAHNVPYWNLTVFVIGGQVLEVKLYGKNTYEIFKWLLDRELLEAPPKKKGSLKAALVSSALAVPLALAHLN